MTTYELLTKTKKGKSVLLPKFIEETVSVTEFTPSGPSTPSTGPS